MSISVEIARSVEFVENIINESLVYKHISDLCDHHTESFIHVRYVALLCDAACRCLGLSENLRVRVDRAALLHDTGKTKTSLEILSEDKRPLTPEERETLKAHPLDGFSLLSQDFDDPIILTLALTHHRWKKVAPYPTDSQIRELVQKLGSPQAELLWQSEEYRTYEKLLTGADVFVSLGIGRGFNRRKGQPYMSIPNLIITYWEEVPREQPFLKLIDPFLDWENHRREEGLPDQKYGIYDRNKLTPQPIASRFLV